MEIISLRTIHGPNVYHHLPVVVMRLDLRQWAEKASNEIPGFIERLKDNIPGLYEHTCSPGKLGGFFERLNKGTYLAHITEHVALELSKLVGFDISYGKSRFAGSKGVYDVVLRSPNDEGIKECLRSAVQIVIEILAERKIDLQKYQNAILSKSKENALGPSADSIYTAAKKLKIPVRRIAANSLLQLGYGKNQQRVQAAVSDRTSLIAADIVQDKELTKQLLSRSLVPTPLGVVISSEIEIDEAIKQFSGPYVLKPIDGSHGDGVFLNLENAEEIKSALKTIQKFSSRFLLEKMHTGKDYRILVIDGKLAAAAERSPPQITGDGNHTITELIEMLNQDPLRGEGHESFFTKVAIDEIMVEYLKKQNLQPDSVLKLGQRIQLRGNANLSCGGTAIDVTGNVSDEIKILCERVSRIVGLDICGIDIIAKDISLSVKESELTVLEVNAGPGLRMHLLGKLNSESHVGTKIVKMLYNDSDDSRIPIISVTGTNGKTTVVRLLHKIMLDGGQTNVGMTNTDGIWIGKNQIAKGDSSGPASAELLLQDSSVESAIFEIARGGLLRAGLAYDWSDVGVLTNIKADHIGQDGIEDIDDILWIKSVVIERVRRNGTIVLNADDASCVKLLKQPKIRQKDCRLILFSTRFDNPNVVNKLAFGATGIWVEDDQIILAEKEKVRSLGHVADIPITLGGKAEFQVANVLAAIGAALGAGVSTEQIMRSIKNFNPAVENIGRLSLYRIRSSHVVLDYGHNPDAIGRIGEMLSKFHGYTKTAIMGLPGDRSTELIKQSALQAAKYFDKIILRDESDLRGRQPAEIPSMLAETYKSQFPALKHEVILNEDIAVYHVLNQLDEKSIVVIFYENLSNVLSVLRKFDPVAVLDLPEDQRFIPEVNLVAAWPTQ